MGQIANYEEWITRTNYDWRHPRSSDLKELDKKVKYYFVNWMGSNHERAKNQCMAELEKYVKKKWKENPTYQPDGGGMGKTLSIRHPRNKDGAFQSLTNTLISRSYVADASMTAAHNIVLDHQGNLLDSLLYSATGLPMRFTRKDNQGIKDKFLAGCRTVASATRSAATGKTFATGAPKNNPGATGTKAGIKDNIKPVAFQAEQLARKAHTAASHLQHPALIETPLQEGARATRELTPYLGGEIAGHVGSAIAEVVPILGHIIAAGRLATCAVTCVQTHMLKDDLTTIANTGYVAPGIPESAINAVIRMYGRLAIQADVALGMATAKFGAQFDPTRTATAVVGAADAARKIVELMATMIMEYKEVEAANDIILRKTYKTNFENMFISCPLMGAYIVIGSDTSSLLNVAVKYYGTDGWTIQVAEMRRSIEKLYEASRALVAKSKYEIRGFPKMPMAQADIPASAISLGARGGKAISASGIAGPRG